MISRIPAVLITKRTINQGFCSSLAARQSATPLIIMLQTRIGQINCGKNWKSLNIIKLRYIN